jgi:GTP cyclohydrolase I
MTNSSRPTEEQAEEAVRTLIRYIGDSPERSGLAETPKRVLKAWREEWGKGYLSPPPPLKSFDAGSEGIWDLDQMIVVRGISFFSTCEHHLAPFHGVAHIAYIPKRIIVGLSKMARVVEHFSRRLQVQERLTAQIADYLYEQMDPYGVGVTLRATHLCMCSRGVRQPGSEALTSAMRGRFLEHSSVKKEFLDLVQSR